MIKVPTVSLYFDKRRMRAGWFSVKYTIYYDGKQKEFASGLQLQEHEVEFLKDNKNGISRRVKDEEKIHLWDKVYGESYINPDTGSAEMGYLCRAEKILKQIGSYFSFELFAQILSGDYRPEDTSVYSTDLLKALRDRANRFEEQEDWSSSKISSNTASSFERFAIFKKIANAKHPKLPMQIVTKKFLSDYEKWMLKFGRGTKRKNGPDTPASISTVAIYARNARTVFNEAIEAKVIDRDLYPFGKGGYVIPASTNTKKALTQEVIQAIYELDCPNVSQEKARDLWLFSYLCHGMNFMDICHLKRSDYNATEPSIQFVREKTKDANRQDMKSMKVLLLPRAVEIIEKWGNQDARQEAFLFPFLRDEMTLDRRLRTVKQVIKNTNDQMANVSAALNLNVKVRTYEARHSFATTLLRSETPLAFISQSLGHSSLATTEKYLGSFEIEQTQRYLSVLIPKSINKENESTEVKQD